MRWKCLSVAILLFTLVLVRPAMTQHVDANSLAGQVLSVDERAHQVKLGLYLLANSPSAPGKVPDDMALQIAQFNQVITDSEAKAAKAHNPQRRDELLETARKAREMVERLKCWREIDQDVATTERIPVLGVRRVGIGQVTRGAHVRLVVSVPATTVETPNKVILLRDVLQISPRVPSTIRRYADRTGDSNNYLELVGDVTGANPLTITVQGKTVEVETRAQSRFIQIERLAMRDLTPGQFIFVHVQKDGELRIRRITRIAIAFNEKELPPFEDADMEL